MRYPYAEVEEKWQKYWADKKVHKTNFEKTDNKLYTLVMFIYPSGAKSIRGKIALRALV